MLANLYPLPCIDNPNDEHISVSIMQPGALVSGMAKAPSESTRTEKYFLYIIFI